MKSNKQTIIHSFKVGDIVYSSWGYDQTNVEFYEVVKVTQKTVSIQAIRSDIVPDGFMCGRATPRPGEYESDDIITRIPKSGRMRISSFSAAWAWDGQSKYCSWYA